MLIKAFFQNINYREYNCHTQVHGVSAYLKWSGIEQDIRCFIRLVCSAVLS